MTGVLKGWTLKKKTLMKWSHVRVTCLTVILTISLEFASRTQSPGRQVPVSSGKCKVFDNEFKLSNQVTYLLDKLSSTTCYLSKNLFFLFFKNLAGVKRNGEENVSSFFANFFLSDWFNHCLSHWHMLVTRPVTVPYMRCRWRTSSWSRQSRSNSTRKPRAATMPIIHLSSLFPRIFLPTSGKYRKNLEGLEGLFVK